MDYRVYRALELAKKGFYYAGIGVSIIAMLDITIVHVAHAATSDWHITTYFGQTDEVHAKPHKGVDFAIDNGTPVRSIVDGKVVAVLDEGKLSWGKSVHIQDSSGEVLIYGHLSEVRVHTGQDIHFHDVVALSGSTGDSTGPHLHVQVNINGKPIDPMPLIKQASDRIGRELASK